MIPIRAVVVFVSVLLLSAACGGGTPASQLAKAPTLDLKDQTKCGVRKSQASPLIVEWPSAERQRLETRVRKAASAKAAVVVRYQGCEMEVLPRCSAPASYVYAGTTRKEDKVEIRNEDELYANLPVGAVKFEGRIAQSQVLTVEMDFVGRYESDRERVRVDELVGECDGATHFISALSVGAFNFFAGGRAAAGGGVGMLGAGAGGDSKSARETLSRDGEPEACAKTRLDDKAPPEQCGALIRIEVVPLGEAKKAEPTCPDGTQWDGSQCLGRRVVTKVDCPIGTTWDGGRCKATVDTTCSSGMHFADGRGCVPDTAPTGATGPTLSAASSEPAATVSVPGEPRADASADAFLNINSIPASSITLDGMPIGMTPRSRVQVKPGTHRVRFVGPDGGTKEVSIIVKAGEVKPVVLRLN